MSNTLSELAWKHSAAEGTELLVLLKLTDNAGEESGIAWPSVPYLAQRCRVSVRTVQRALRRLEELGEIEAVERGSGRHSTRYRILLAERCQDGTADARGDTGDARGVTDVTAAVPRVSPEPSVEPPLEPSGTAARARERVEVVFAHYRERFPTKRPVLDAPTRKLIENALKVAAPDPAEAVGICCVAIDGLAASEYHREHGFTALKYALQGGGRNPDVQATLNRLCEVATRAATNGRARPVRLQHSTQDLSIYDRGIIDA